MGDYWQLTVDILQNESSPIVDKPKLQEKYLIKPPFRYLHDVISAVQKNTGFASGLFSGDELDGKAIQDKDAKVHYLQKIMSVVGMVLSEPVPAKALKIVAGLEPENTNVFLQMLGRASQMGNGAAAVQRVLAGETEVGPSAGDSARPSSRPSSQRAPAEEEAVPAPPSPAPDPPAATRTKRSSDSKGEKEAKPEKEKRSSRAGKREEPPTPAPAPAAKSKSRSKAEEPPPLGPSEAPSARAMSPPPSDDPQRRALMRPQSARKAPPKVGGPPLPTSGTGTGGMAPSIVGGAVAAPSSGASTTRNAGRRPTGDGARTVGTPPSAAMRPVSVMEEGKAGAESDDDVEVVHEATPVAIGAGREAGGEGVLVRNIMDAEKNLKKAGEEAASGAEAQGTGIILKRLGKGAGAAGGAAAVGGAVRTQDTNAMREMVQKLCQSSHPLAKSMDYLQEDLENMSKEYRFWQVEKRSFADKLALEQRMVGDNTASEANLAGLDEQVKQVRDRILGVKGQVLRHDETINKLLQMAVSGGR